MNSLVVEVPKLELPNLESPNVRYRDGEWGKIKEVLSKHTKCHLCNAYIWLEEARNYHMREAFYVLDPQYYPDNIVPDYLKFSHVLLAQHYKCPLE